MIVLLLTYNQPRKYQTSQKSRKKELAQIQSAGSLGEGSVFTHSVAER